LTKVDLRLSTCNINEPNLLWRKRMTMLGSDLARAIMAPQQKMAVWIKGHTIPGLDPAVWRRDDDGNTIRYPDYGDRNAYFGWEIDAFLRAMLTLSVEPTTTTFRICGLCIAPTKPPSPRADPSKRIRCRGQRIQVWVSTSGSWRPSNKGEFKVAYRINDQPPVEEQWAAFSGGPGAVLKGDVDRFLRSLPDHTRIGFHPGRALRSCSLEISPKRRPADSFCGLRGWSHARGRCWPLFPYGTLRRFPCGCRTQREWWPLPVSDAIP
jgi:hypothetical protein